MPLCRVISRAQLSAAALGQPQLQITTINVHDSNEKEQNLLRWQRLERAVFN